MIAWILGYLLIGELCAAAFVTWVACFNNRFVAHAVRPHWRDLGIYFVVQLLWPAAAPVLIGITIHLWRRAVQNEVCVCGHRRGRHLDGHGCTEQAVNSAWIVRGEGEQFFYCKCPKFTNPNVRPRK